jgi:signal transduction histidine kinase
MTRFSITRRNAFVITAFLILPFNMRAQKILVLTGGDDDIELSPYLDVLEDKEGRWTIQEVLSPEFSQHFTPASERGLNPGITNSAWWVRFELVDSANNGNEWVLQVNYPGISKVDLFIVTPSHQIQSKHGGALVPFNQREVKDRYTAFRIGSQGTISHRLYVRFESQSSIALNMRLRTLQQYVAVDHDAQFYLGGFYGSVLILILYNLFLFLALRDTSYLYYLLYVAGYVFHQIVVDGLYQEYFFPNSIVESVRIFQMAIGFFILFGSLFTQRILSSSRFSPLLHKGLVLCAVFGGGVFILTPFVSGQLINRLLSVVIIPYAFIGMAMAVVSIRHRYTPARFYLLAVTGFLVGLLVRSLRVSGFLPLNPFTENTLQIGMVWEMTMFSFALGDRINMLKVEKEREKEDVRRRIAADLHDEIGSNLSSISMTSQMVRRSAKLDEQNRNRLADIAATAKETTDAIRDIVWFINPEHDTLADLVLKLKDATSKLLAGLDYTFKASDYTIETMPDILVGKEIYLLYKEVLHNIVKHARAGKVDIEIRSQSNRFVLTVCDNGIGFEVGKVQEGLGLKNFRDRAEKIGAKLDFTSCPGQGTKITLSVPI